MQFTPQQIRKAFYIWQYKCRFVLLDDKVRALSGFKNDLRYWLVEVREARCLTTRQVAERMAISQAAYSKLEAREPYRKITLEALHKAAEAMDCEFVYALRPKNGELFAQPIWQKVLPLALKQPWLKACDPRKREIALAAMARAVLETPAFRREEGLGKNKRPPLGGLSKIRLGKRQA